MSESLQDDALSAKVAGGQAAGQQAAAKTMADRVSPAHGPAADADTSADAAQTAGASSPAADTVPTADVAAPDDTVPATATAPLATDIASADGATATEAPAPSADVASPTDTVPAAATASAAKDAASSAADGATTELGSGPAQSSWMARLRRGLSKTSRNLGGLFTGARVDESLYEELETALVLSDAGLDATQQILDRLRSRARREGVRDAAQLRSVLEDVLTEHLQGLEKPFVVGETAPMVVMIAGVNGVGKTTSIGKLAHALRASQASVLLAAGDTFRAAAREQLVAWGERNGVSVIAQQEGGDPAAVAFDAVQAGKARASDVVLVDTAGRLPTQLHLMEELKKIRRAIERAEASAPHEVLLVVDGNTGQNALAQIRAFDEALGLTGLIITKLDGTAKGGILAAVAAGSNAVRAIPVYWVGVGEGMQDLQPFVARQFAQALLSTDNRAIA